MHVVLVHHLLAAANILLGKEMDIVMMTTITSFVALMVEIVALTMMIGQIGIGFVMTVNAKNNLSFFQLSQNNTK